MFLADGHFRFGSNRKSRGTYTLRDYALTLRFADGTLRRWSYARGLSGETFLHGEFVLSGDAR